MLQVISVLGALGCLIPFAALQFKKMNASGLLYTSMNFLGSATLTAVAIIEHQYGFILLEGIWAIVSAVGVVKSLSATRG